VRFLVELTRGAGGRVSGQVAAADGPPAPFSGWLELLRLLEDGMGAHGRDGSVPDQDDAQEATWDG
jgi:hypothetical protein